MKVTNKGSESVYLYAFWPSNTVAESAHILPPGVSDTAVIAEESGKALDGAAASCESHIFDYSAATW